MRMPVRSEKDAFRLSLSSAALVGVAVLSGMLFDPLVGVLVIALAAVAAPVWGLTRTDPQRGSRLRDAEQAGRAAVASRHRILMIANATPTDDLARDEILPADGSSTLEVLAPVLQSRTHFVTTDIDRETEHARQRLSATLAWARRQGLRATGIVGDPIDPVAGIADELRRFEVDEIVLLTHPFEDANWLEHGMLTTLRDALDVPVRHVVVCPPARGAATEANPPTQEVVMSDTVETVMTLRPVCMDVNSTLTDAARAMDEHDIGAVLVMRDERLFGIMTDRDIAIRAVARGAEPTTTTLSDVCTRQPITLRPGDAIDVAIARMREHAVRRMPVLDAGEPVGVVSLGDLATVRDRRSVLGEISAAPANH
jgi:CBS domain-containing protein